jgi:outer membrane biogenesis lipoprotein LolB
MSIESLTKDGLGWTLPLDDLSYYVLGAAPGDAGGLERDAAGRASRLQRDGWDVRWTAREGAAAENATPARLDLGKDDVEIRLVIDSLQRRP